MQTIETQNPATFDTVKVQMIHTEATSAAKAAVAKLLDEWTEKTGGNQYGEPMYCGLLGWTLRCVRIQNWARPSKL